MSSRDTFRPRSGKTIPFRAIDDEEARQRLIAAGIPEAYAPAMLGFYAAYRAGWSAPGGDLERLPGRPPTPPPGATPPAPPLPRCGPSPPSWTAPTSEPAHADALRTPVRVGVRAIACVRLGRHP